MKLSQSTNFYLEFLYEKKQKPKTSVAIPCVN